MSLELILLIVVKNYFFWKKNTYYQITTRVNISKVTKLLHKTDSSKYIFTAYIKMENYIYI